MMHGSMIVILRPVAIVLGGTFIRLWHRSRNVCTSCRVV